MLVHPNTPSHRLDLRCNAEVHLRITHASLKCKFHRQAEFLVCFVSHSHLVRPRCIWTVSREQFPLRPTCATTFNGS
ncbi:hypothetical protein BDR04DRAFT_1109575 [Suillus decipiens]|nr:hypothetical protein BDR04DRAFT_1109575 [Suillus decipiens]